MTLKKMGARFESWFRQNSFHHFQFEDTRALTSLKERKGLKISLCIPTLNEEETIGRAVAVYRTELVERFPLIDEILVIDSGSNDNTRSIAQELGATVFLSSEILPELGSMCGKGENLWKGVYQISGDIVVYVDADIQNVHPRFVYGLAAPLIHRPDVAYVKGYYDRTTPVACMDYGCGGGRVTETLIRPLLSMFMPELSAIIQPLSGEYAARREVLEQIPFPVGYGVEIAHLMDVYKLFGLRAFAQTDLKRRVHRHRQTCELGKMAFGILHTFWHRFKEWESIQSLPARNHILRQFNINDGKYEPSDYLFAYEERPPMINVPQYVQKFGLRS